MAGGNVTERVTASSTPVLVESPVDHGSEIVLSGAGFSLQASARDLTNSPREDPDTIMLEPIEEREAWAAYEAISEVSTLVDGTGNLLSQCRFYPGVQGRDKYGEQVDLTLEQVASLNLPGFEFLTANNGQFMADAYDAFARYTDDSGSQAGLIRPMAQSWSVVGRVKVAGWIVDDNNEPINDPVPSLAGDQRERWVALAPGSMWRINASRPAPGWQARLSRLKTTNIPQAVVKKLWWPHPRYPDDALGWVRAALDVCRDVRAFSLGNRSSARSGIPADLFIVPLEASPRKPNPTGTGPGEEGAVEAAQQAADQWAADVEGLLGEFILGVLEDYNSGGAAVPGVLAVESRFIQFFQKLSFARPMDPGITTSLDQAIQRLSTAADCPPEMLTGLGGTNRWNGAQIADDEYRRYFRPKAMALADGYTVALYWADMRARGYSDQQIMMTRTLVDARDVVASPDWSKLMPNLLDRAVVGPSGARRMLKIPDWAKPTKPEIELMLEFKAAAKPQGQSAGGGQGDTGAPSGTPTVDPSKGSLIDTTAVERVLAANGLDLTTVLLGVERDTFTRLEEACEAALSRVIDRAGSSLRNMARAAGRKGDGDLAALALEPDPARLVAKLGPERAARLVLDLTPTQRRDLFLVGLAALLVTFRRIAQAAYTASLAALGETLPQGEVDAAIDRGAAVLSDSMVQVADQEVFGGSPSAPTPGESTELRVPGGVLRRALAVAGGALNIGAGTTPAGATFGIAFGALMGTVSPASTRLMWDYGPSARATPFEPHEELDGQVFDGPDDDALAGAPWSTGMYEPGDHDGCRCMWARVFDTPAPAGQDS